MIFEVGFVLCRHVPVSAICYIIQGVLHRKCNFLWTVVGTGKCNREVFLGCDSPIAIQIG